jgi:threonylcarbamoyladenosine tRNA methylthiotransferase MtaB
MAKVALYTLGCKVNQYETERIADDFRSKGFEVVGFSDRADVYVINSCTVTRTADGKSRHAARLAARRNPDATVVLTGCYVESAPEQVSGIAEVSLVIGNREKDSLVRSVVDRLGLSPYHTGRDVGSPDTLRANTRNRTRALLKIQDGCDQFCAYCVVPFARTIMWSKPSDQVLAEAGELARLGYKEIVLTGVRLGRYEDERLRLRDLIDQLTQMPGIRRVRLSSLELTDMPSGLLELMVANPKVCRHLHIPLQSGDDGVLKRMKRPYTAGQFKSFVEQARSLAPEIAVTTDVMVGFVGETDTEFESSYKFAESLRFARMHVFRYSPRPRTAASELPDDVSAREKARRSARMIDLGDACAQELAQAMVGKIVGVLVEGKELGTSLRSGLTDNYVRVVFEADAHLVGEIVKVHVDRTQTGTAYGHVVWQNQMPGGLSGREEDGDGERVLVLQDCAARNRLADRI